MEASKVQTQGLNAASDADGDGFDLTGWEGEPEQQFPQGDPTLADAAGEIQDAIAKHQPIDTSIDWEDFEAYLPKRSSPLQRVSEVVARERLPTVPVHAIHKSAGDMAKEKTSESGDGETDALPSLPSQFMAVGPAQIAPSISAITLPERSQVTAPTLLDKVLAFAMVLGIAVEDDRKSEIGKVWVNILEAPDGHSRKLVRKLLDMGFEFRPGKGYWK